MGLPEPAAWRRGDTTPARQRVFTIPGLTPRSLAGLGVARAVNLWVAMNRLAKLSSLLVVACAVLDAAPAAAQPVVRDHRTESQPVVRDHRTERAQPAPEGHTHTRRHRRRPGPRFMMPLKIDIGAQGANTTKGFLPGIEVRVGIHWASLSPKPTNFDVGLGVFGAALVGPQTESMPDANNDVVYGGAYLEVGQTLSRGNYWRTWAAGRGEYLGSNTFGEDHTGFGVAGRLSAELFLSGIGIEPRGIFFGTYAIGVYAEAAGRGLGDDVSALQVSGGLTFRTPLVFSP